MGSSSAVLICSPPDTNWTKPELLFEKIEDDTIQAQVDKLLATKKANEAAGYKANPLNRSLHSKISKNWISA